MDYNEAFDKLKKFGQQHLLKFYEELDEKCKEELLQQIAALDMDFLRSIAQEKSARGKIEPIEVLRLDKISEHKEQYTEEGIKAVREGKVSLVLLAGGMGSRLGSDSPKGVYNIGIHRDVYIFQRLIENIITVVERAGTWIPLYIMTSDINHEETVEFLSGRSYFGYHKEYIHFYKQDMVPITDFNGKIVLEEKHKIGMSPNGNGGWFSSLMNSSAGRILKDSNTEWINVFAVDNVLQSIADPAYIGALLSGGYPAGAKVIRKNHPDEKVGVMCLEDGRASIVEYYELTDEMREMKNADGEYAYGYGTILNYLFRLDMLMNTLHQKLPLHQTAKKYKHIDETGCDIEPEEPNCYKYETLALDLVHMSDRCLLFEVERDKEFAPIKNLHGIDSVESAQNLLLLNGIPI